VRSAHTEISTTLIQAGLNRAEHGTLEIDDRYLAGLDGLADFDYAWLLTWLDKLGEPGTHPRSGRFPSCCEATEIDLAWTYVGGSAGLVRQLLAETRIEALPAAPAGELGGIEDWVTAQAEQAAGQLLSGGEAAVTTCRGMLRASLKRPGRLRSGMLLVWTTGDNGVTGSSSTPLSR
jgi:hypothetical protein